MRQIKFRGKRLDNGEWAYGDLQHPHTSCRIIGYDESETDMGLRTDFRYNDVIPETIGQFTGLYDNNGNEIYEGDIILIKGLYSRVVLWDKMMWALIPTEYYNDGYFGVMNLQHPRPGWWEKYSKKIEIIGNIHDNPQRLK